MKIENQDYRIRPIQNGFLVEYSYSLERNEQTEKMTRYREETNMFTTWDEVTEWIKNNPLPIATN